MRIEECQAAVVVALELVVAFCGALKQKRVARLKGNLARLPIDTLSLTGHSHKHHIVFLLKVALRHRLSDKVAAEGYVCGAHLAAGVDVVDAPHVVVGGGKAVSAFEFKNLVDLACVD